MTDHDIDRFAVQQILGGLPPEEAPPALAGAAEAIGGLRVPARPAELVGEMSVVARMAEAIVLTDAAQLPRRPRMFPKFLTARFAVATALGVASLGGVAAASGSLPRPVQRAVADAVGPVISLPDSSNSSTTRTVSTGTGSSTGSGPTTTMAAPTTSEPTTTVAPVAAATTLTTACPPDENKGESVSDVANGSTPPTSSSPSSGTSPGAAATNDQHGDEVSAVAHGDCGEHPDVEATTESDAKPSPTVSGPSTTEAQQTEQPDHHGDGQTSANNQQSGDSQGQQGGDHAESGGGSPSLSSRGSGD